MKLVDLSVAIEDSLPSDPPGMIPKIEYSNHDDQVDYMLSFFKDATQEDLPDGKAWSLENVQLTTHAGTHIDAPWHYHPTMNNGEKAWTIDEVPLDWFIGNGVVIDMTDKPDGYLVTSKDLIEKLEEINYTLKEKDIVLIHTGASKHWGTKRYLTAGCGLGREATLWLLDRGIRTVGTDAWSWDRPLGLISEEFSKTGNKDIIWEGHFAGIEKGYCQIEKLTNLDQIPATGFTFMCFPVKIKGASAGWIRAIAMVSEAG
ncbi:cyclase family protein [Amphibacillus sp. Q70]|uniref:cyclase family protein n=1 Tax=Amphibacillus sp. Q70 TaxID=3453416 RepID=UPI003F84ACE2